MSLELTCVIEKTFVQPTHDWQSPDAAQRINELDVEEIVRMGYEGLFERPQEHGDDDFRFFGLQRFKLIIEAMPVHDKQDDISQKRMVTDINLLLGSFRGRMYGLREKKPDSNPF